LVRGRVLVHPERERHLVPETTLYGRTLAVQTRFPAVEENMTIILEVEDEVLVFLHLNMRHDHSLVMLEWSIIEYDKNPEEIHQPRLIVL
jgi:hypothetical protein